MCALESAKLHFAVVTARSEQLPIGRLHGKPYCTDMTADDRRRIRRPWDGIPYFDGAIHAAGAQCFSIRRPGEACRGVCMGAKIISYREPLGVEQPNRAAHARTG